MSAAVVAARALAARAGARFPCAAPAFAAYATKAPKPAAKASKPVLKGEETHTSVSIVPAYTAEATATGARNGHVKSSDGALDLELTFPKALGGPGIAGRTDPEQLFAAAYAACFQGAMGLAAKALNIKLPESNTVTARVSIGKHPEEPGFALGVELRFHAPELAEEDLHSVILEAHEICPYSRAIRGNVDVKFTVC
ncbi:hypothetical protein IWQ57_000496 [Coemansia nantahalensis]|uniref:Uncharacterized protein n=1 Tax=Coemansia nantahalensis TaxID=2789366 RepID=A0ACC1K7P2_9FUNG|nr:hypothetical protein IWQ57_000496 [Coemansia nantahalensis]